MIRLFWVAIALALGGCGTPLPRLPDRLPEPVPAPRPAPPAKTAAKPSAPSVQKKGGGYYKDDGPGDFAPADIDAIPDAVPKPESLHRFANNPYSALGRDYVPMKRIAPYKARGIGSWYGKKFHGQKTSSGERYDMYGMTAAHPTLPIPSYVRVSRPGTGRAVVVRVNDRGPFHAGRLIDLSWTAAYKLGYIEEGSTLVEVELIQPGQTLPSLAASPQSGDDPILQFAAGEPSATKPLQETQDVAGYYIQLGAFGNRENAESLRTHLERELGALGEKLVIRPAGKVYRLQLGPWPDPVSAREAGDRLRETFGLAPGFVSR